MSAILINPPSLPARRGSVQMSFLDSIRRDMSPDQYGSMPIEHLGLMSLAASARRRGLDIATVNGQVSGHSSLDETWGAIQQAARDVGPPALVGFSDIDMIDEVRDLAMRCRSEWSDAVIVLGNAFGSLNYHRVLTEYQCIDYVIVGEGESSLALLLEAVLSGASVEHIPALAWRGPSGAIMRNELVPLDLDDLPWPERDELRPTLAQGFAGAVFSSRGCPYRCTFCGTAATSELIPRETYRLKSIANVVDEIEYLSTEYGMEFVTISDDLFLSKHPTSQGRAAAFANEILRRHLRINFMFDARLDSITDLALFAHLKRAGLRRVYIGIESGSYDQLASYHKYHMAPGEDVAGRIQGLRDLGVEVVPGMIMWQPTARPGELRETVRLLRATGDLKPYKLTQKIQAYAGTQLWKQYRERGLLSTEWPLAEWEFADPIATRVFEEVCDMASHPEANYDDIENLFLASLDDWEARLGDAAERPSASPTRIYLPVRDESA